MGDPSVCYPWEYEYEGPPTGTLTPHCHPGDSDDSLLCFFRFSYCLWYDSLEQLGHWHWDEIMSGFRACGVVVMVLWFLEFARAMHGDHSLPEVPEPAAAAVDELPAVDEDTPAAAVGEGQAEEASAVVGGGQAVEASALGGGQAEERVPTEPGPVPAEEPGPVPAEEPGPVPAEPPMEDLLGDLLGEPRTVLRPGHTVSERQHIQQQLDILAQLSADAARGHVSQAQQARCLRAQQQVDFTTVPHLLGLLHCATQGLMLLAEQTAVLARRQEETQRHFEMMLLAQRRQNREAMEKLQLQHARGSQQLLGVIQNQMGLSVGGVTPGMSGTVTPGPAPVTPVPRSTMPPAKRRSRCNRCDACTTPLAANVRRQWCETWKPAGAVPRGPDGRYLKREADDEGAEKQKKKKLKKEKKKRVAEAREHNPILGPDDDFDSGGDSAEELFGAPAAVPLVPVLADE